MKTVQINGSQVEIYSLTGEVQDFKERVESHVHASGGGGHIFNGSGRINKTVIHSTNTLHQDIFLMDDSDRLHAIQLTDWKVAFACGHKLTVSWIMKRGEKSGEYVFLHNHSTQQSQWKDDRLKRFCRYGIPACLKWSIPICCAVCGVIWDFGGLKFGLFIGAATGAYINAIHANPVHVSTLRNEISAIGN